MTENDEERCESMSPVVEGARCFLPQGHGGYKHSSDGDGVLGLHNVIHWPVH